MFLRQPGDVEIGRKVTVCMCGHGQCLPDGYYPGAADARCKDGPRPVDRAQVRHWQGAGVYCDRGGLGPVWLGA